MIAFNSHDLLTSPDRLLAGFAPTVVVSKEGPTIGLPRRETTPMMPAPAELRHQLRETAQTVLAYVLVHQYVSPYCSVFRFA
jgi:hypothetical protein